MRKPRTPSAVNKLRLQKQLCRIRSLSQELLPSCRLRQNQAIATFCTNQTRRRFPPCPTMPIRGRSRRKRKICKALRQTNRHLNWQDGASENATHHPATGEADGSVTDIAGWKASLPPYATDLHYQQLNATQLNELIGKGGLWACKARREMARRKYK